MKTFIAELNQNEVKLVSGGAGEINNTTAAKDDDSFSGREIMLRVFADFIVSLIVD